MKTALNRTRGRAANSGGMFDRGPAAPAADRDAVSARVAAATCLDVGGIDRQRHIDQIVQVVLAARRQ